MIGVMEDKKIFEQLAYKIAREVAAEKDRRHGVILEDIQGKFQFLVEGQNAMEKRMDGFDTQLARVETKVDNLEVQVCGIETKVDGIAAELRQKADKKDVVALECRVTKLEHL
jgi:predicted  nucleic acid-binding Zn-ribbon protein